MNKRLTEEESLAFISSRRSVFPKEFEESKVSREEIEKLLEAARWAPTHKVTEPWSFVVVSGNALEEFKDILVEIIKEKGPGRDPIDVKIERTLFKLSRVSCLIAIINKRDEQERVPEDEELWATACAVQNIHLHASSLNIGCYWSTGAGRNKPVVRSFLGIGENDHHMGWLFVGRYSGQKNLVKDRKSVSDYSRWL